MTDERPYGRHFAPRVDDSGSEDPHSKGVRDFESTPVPIEDGEFAGAEAPVDTDELTRVEAPVGAGEPVGAEALVEADESAEAEAPAEHDVRVDEAALQESAIDEPLEDGDRRDPKPSRKRVMGVTVLVVLLVIAVLAAGIAFFVNHSIAEGRRKFEASMQHMIDQSGSTIEHDGVTYRLNENMVTVAFIGFDGKITNITSGDQTTGQSDTVMVLALNADTGKTTCILIPRDSWVDVDTYIAGNYSGQQKMQICLQYTYGNSNEESSQLVAQCASRVLSGMPIDYYFTLDVKGVGPLADAIGGVKLTPVKSVEKYDIHEGEETVLTGERAQEYVQYRDYVVDISTLERQQRQLSFIKAFAAQVLESAAGDPAKLISLYQTALQYTWTNLGIEEFSYLASIMAEHGASDFELKTLEGEFSSQDGHAVLYLDQEQVTQTVLDVFYTPAS